MKLLLLHQEMVLALEKYFIMWKVNMHYIKGLIAYMF